MLNRNRSSRLKRVVSLCLMLAVATSVAGSVLATPEKNPPRPNIILIMADDMGFSDIGCYGGEIRTPNLDRLAAGGLRFTQFYNTGRCCPTRASLLTGLYPHQAGVGHMMDDHELPGYRGDLNDRCVTLAEVLRAAGYRTYMSGKWHVTGHSPDTAQDTGISNHNWPLQRGFDRYYGTLHGANSFFDPGVVIDDNRPVDDFPEDYYYTDAINDAAAQFIDDHAARRGDDRVPLFLYVSHTAPHWPLHALPEDIERYRGRYDAGWDALRAERHERMIQMGLIRSEWDMSERDPRAPAWDAAENKAWQARRMEVYAAQIDRMDQGIGRILAALQRHDIMDNTLIVFLSDNGGCAEEITEGWRRLLQAPRGPATTRDGTPVQLGNDPSVMPGGPETYQSYGLPWANASNTPFRLYKSVVHEGGIATPLIAHWPAGIARSGELDHQFGHVIDFMATFADLAGAAYPDEVDGRPIHPMEGVSLAPAFTGRKLERGTPIFFEHQGARAIRDGQWKLVARGPTAAWELYDMEADRTETRNLAARDPQRVEQMSTQWRQWAERANVLPWPWKEQ